MPQREAPVRPRASTHGVSVPISPSVTRSNSPSSTRSASPCSIRSVSPSSVMSVSPPSSPLQSRAESSAAAKLKSSQEKKTRSPLVRSPSPSPSIPLAISPSVDLAHGILFGLSPPKEHSNENSTQLENIIFELVITEWAYLQDLHLLLLARDEVRKLPNMSLTDADAVFGSIDQIALVARELYIKFTEKSININSTEYVAAVFVDMSAFFKCYIAFCSGQAQALKILEYLKTKSEFKQFLKKIHEKKEYRKLPLDALIIKPVQRVCKYPLLLREMRKAAGPDLIILNTAIQQLESIMQQVDERQYTSSLDERFVNLQQELVSSKPPLNLVSPSRRLIRDGALTHEKKVKGKLRPIPGHYYLLTDMFLFTKRNLTGGLKVKVLIGLEGATFSETLSLPGQHAFIVEQGKEKWRFLTNTYDEKLIVLVEASEMIHNLKANSARRGLFECIK